MVLGYGGTYRGVVVDDADPLQQYRLGVIVPDVYGENVSVWATALWLSDTASPLPVVGDVVLVSFEHGDSDYPIWEPGSGVEERGGGAGGYIGKYRGAVTGNDDPMQQNRLEVTVPEVDPSTVWAMPSDDTQYTDPPNIGTEVWIEYDSGDPAYPRWVGLA